MGLAEDLARVKDRIDGLERKRARREADFDVAKQRRDEALGVLKERFGCSSVEEARVLFKQMEEEVAQVLVEIEQALEVAERATDG